MTSQPEAECDPHVYKNGKTVAVMAGTSTAIEAIVVRVREDLKVALDWHYVGGRANILTTAPAKRHAEIRYRLHAAIPSWLGNRPEMPRASNSPERG